MGIGVPGFWGSCLCHQKTVTGLDNRGASALRGEFLAAYRRYLPALGPDGEERREQCLRWLEEFLEKNGI